MSKCSPYICRSSAMSKGSEGTKCASSTSEGISRPSLDKGSQVSCEDSRTPGPGHGRCSVGLIVWHVLTFGERTGTAHHLPSNMRNVRCCKKLVPNVSTPIPRNQKSTSSLCYKLHYSNNSCPTSFPEVSQSNTCGRFSRRFIPPTFPPTGFT